MTIKYGDILYHVVIFNFAVHTVRAASSNCREICATRNYLSSHCACTEDQSDESHSIVKRDYSGVYNPVFKLGGKRFTPEEVISPYHGIQRRIFRWGKRSIRPDRISRDVDEEEHIIGARSPRYGYDVTDLLQLEQAVRSGELDYYDLLSGGDAEVGKRRNSDLQNSIFKWGKRNGEDFHLLDRIARGYKNPIFKWGKRNVVESNDYSKYNKRGYSKARGQIFKWGKKSPGVKKQSVQNPIFKWGKRSVDTVLELERREAQMQNPIFKWGKRSTDEEEDKRSSGQMQKSIFKWGKRDDHSAHEKKSSGQMQNYIFKWGKRSSQMQNPIFKWGKRSDTESVTGEESIKPNPLLTSEDANEVVSKRGMQNQIFKWGKRSDIENNAWQYSHPPAVHEKKRGMKNQIFKWGKRNQGEATKRGGKSSFQKNIFKWGKRTYSKNDNPIFKWGRKREPALTKTSLTTSGEKKKRGKVNARNPIFKWGKRFYNTDKTAKENYAANVQDSTYRLEEKQSLENNKDINSNGHI